MLIETNQTCARVAPGRVVPDLLEDVRRCLLTTPRTIPPKYFYDSHGSELFDQICDTVEYYPTRTEAALLNEHSSDIIRQSTPDEIIELGSGTSQKTRHLFDACEDNEIVCTYAPFDVCESMLEDSAALIRADYDWLQVNPLLGDYNAGFDHLPDTPGKRLFVFLGGTIGNFSRPDAVRFLREIHSVMNPGDHLLIGVDRDKDRDILNAAYNDAGGITARFNLNVLNVINRELGADFDLDQFKHVASYNILSKQIEMYLEAQSEQTVTIEQLDTSIHIQENECILTEISCKYDDEEFSDLLTSNGLRVMEHYTPVNSYFSLFLACVN